MSRVYLHSKNDSNSLIKIMLYLFIPFIIYGFYKNGLVLYQKDYCSVLGMLRPLIILGISIFISIIFCIINKEQKISYRLLSNIMIAMVVSPNINLIIYIGLLAVLNLAQKYLKFNSVPIFMVITLIIDLISKKISFLNAMESVVEHNYMLMDFLLGKGPGGISNTLLVASLISLGLLAMNVSYKKQIPMMAFISYYTLAIITAFINGTLDQTLLLNNNVIFSFVFLSNISIYAPYSKGACYICGLALGLFTYLFYFINIDLGVYIVLTILSFIHPLLDRFIVGKNDYHLIDVL